MCQICPKNYYHSGSIMIFQILFLQNFREVFPHISEWQTLKHSLFYALLILIKWIHLMYIPLCWCIRHTYELRYCIPILCNSGVTRWWIGINTGKEETTQKLEGSQLTSSGLLVCILYKRNDQFQQLKSDLQTLSGDSHARFC